MVLHASMLAAAESPRYVVHGNPRQLCHTASTRRKTGRRPASACRRPTGASDMRDGVVTLSRGDLLAEQTAAQHSR